MNYEYCDGITHTIKKGDTLYEISREHNVPLSMLLRANPYVDVFNLQVGDTICVPAKKTLEKPFLTPLSHKRMPQNDTGAQNTTSQNTSTAGQSAGDGNAIPQSRSAESRTDQDRNTAPQSSEADNGPGTGVTVMPQTIVKDRAQVQELQNTAPKEEIVWKRYVVKLGDTLGDILTGEEQVMPFVEKNGLDKMYMLPGVVYYTPDVKKSTNDTTQ